LPHHGGAAFRATQLRAGRSAPVLHRRAAGGTRALARIDGVRAAHAAASPSSSALSATLSHAVATAGPPSGSSLSAAHKRLLPSKSIFRNAHRERAHRTCVNADAALGAPDRVNDGDFLDGDRRIGTLPDTGPASAALVRIDRNGHDLISPR